MLVVDFNICAMASVFLCGQHVKAVQVLVLELWNVDQVFIFFSLYLFKHIIYYQVSFECNGMCMPYWAGSCNSTN